MRFRSAYDGRNHNRLVEQPCQCDLSSRQASGLRELLIEADFDPWLEAMCQPYYAATLGRPSIPPGVYFRMISVGYFEGIASHRIESQSTRISSGV